MDKSIIRQPSLELLLPPKIEPQVERQPSSEVATPQLGAKIESRQTESFEEEKISEPDSDKSYSNRAKRNR